MIINLESISTTQILWTVSDRNPCVICIYTANTTDALNAIWAMIQRLWSKENLLQWINGALIYGCRLIFGNYLIGAH